MMDNDALGRKETKTKAAVGDVCKVRYTELPTKPNCLEDFFSCNLSIHPNDS